MTFEEWLNVKVKEERKITHGAEVVPYQTDNGLYKIEGVILRVCFDDEHLSTFHNLYFIPEALDKGQNGMYGYNRIMISKPYWKEHGIDDETINTMFHECVHAWDAINGRKDTDGEYHNDVFRKSCEEHGGIALFSNRIDGYNNAMLTEETMKRIMEMIG